MIQIEKITTQGSGKCFADRRFTRPHHSNQEDRRIVAQGTGGQFWHHAVSRHVGLTVLGRLWKGFVTHSNIIPLTVPRHQ